VPEHFSPAVPVAVSAAYDALAGDFSGPELPYDQRLDVNRRYLARRRSRAARHQILVSGAVPEFVCLVGFWCLLQGELLVGDGVEEGLGEALVVGVGGGVGEGLVEVDFFVGTVLGSVEAGDVVVELWMLVPSGR
jgi:hypothetical protein